MSTFDKRVFDAVSFTTLSSTVIGSSTFDSNVFDTLTYAALPEGGLYTFVASSKHIIINRAYPIVAVDALYDAWKTWSIIPANYSAEQAFTTEGGDPLNPFIPEYFYLVNGWKVIVDGFDATFGYNLFTDTGENPVITYNGGTATLINTGISIGGGVGGGLTEEILHAWLDSYKNKPDWQTDPDAIASKVWNQVI